MIQQLNSEKNIDEFVPQIKTITIPAPKRNPMRKQDKFQFLEQEG